jgi:ferric-dicitrate binding protein FerR (iron transport regulator)
MKDHDWQLWIERQTGGCLGPEEIREFEKALLEDPRQLDAYLDDLLTVTALESQHLPPLPTRRAAAWRSRIVAAAAALAMVATAIFLIVPWKDSSGASLATVTDADAVAEAAGIRIGARLMTANLEVPDGSKIGIAMHSGARLEIQGPSNVRLESAKRIHVNRGLVSTYVPPYARGFTVATADGRLVDLGTRFVTATDPDRGTEVHVIEGSVAAFVGANKAAQDLGGEHAAVLRNGKLESIEYLARRFEIPLNAALEDSDGDGFPNHTETFFGADPHDPTDAPAPLRIEESFRNYPPGPVARVPATGPGLEGGAVWEGGGTFIGEGLHYRNNGRELRTSGGCIETVGEGSVGAALSPMPEFPTTGTIYLSFLMRLPATSPGEDRPFGGLLLYKDGREEFFVGDPTSLVTFGSRFLTTDPEQSFGVTLDTDPHLFVIRIDRSNLVTDVYLDPPLGEPESPSLRKTRYYNIPAFDRISIRSGRGIAPYPVLFDEIRVGLTWESVLPLAEK